MEAAAEPWLSILVPVHDVAPYLRRMAGSVLAQADSGVELVLLDDASTDGSGHIADELAAQVPGRVRVIHRQGNAGVAAARNALLGHARGRWWWFVDADDELEGGVLPRLKLLAHADDAPDLLVCDYRVRRGRESIKHRLRGEHHRPGYAGADGARIDGALRLLEGVLASGNVFCWTVIARRELWQGGPRFDEGRVYEDMATMPRLLLRATRARHLAEPWVVYHRRDDSVSGRLSPAKIADLGRALVGVRDELLRRWPDVPPSTRFALAHQAARNLVAAHRHAQRMPERERDALVQALRADFRQAVGEDLALLLRQYRRRAWWARAWTLQRVLG